MSLTIEKSEPVYTYADYKSWDESERIEIIDGVPAMQATPATAHQEACGSLYFLLRQYLKDKPCNVYIAPLSVRLEPAGDDSDTTVLEPDVFVVCDKNKISKDGCAGAPDLVIEVLSPSTARKDRITKFRLYQRAGVREYWIVDTDMRSVHVNILRDNMYMGAVYEEEESVPVHVLPGCLIDLREVFSVEGGEGAEKSVGH